MATILLLQGAQPITLHESESFNKVRKRFVEAQAKKIGYENGAESAYVGPADLSFKTDDGGEGTPGRISVSVEKIIAVCSTQEKDGPAAE